MSDRAPGFHDAVPETEYHADRGTLSHSGAKLLLRAPALFRYRLDNPEYKSVFDFGSAAHAKVLGIGAEVVVHEYDAAKVKSPKATNAWKTEQAEVRERGAVLLLPEEAAVIDAMADQLSGHSTAMQLLSDGRAEVSAYALDEPTGVMRRCRYDWLADSILTDYKTTVDASPTAFANAVARYGYDSQGAWYLDVANDLGHEAQAFAFIAQEKEPPYLVEVYELDADFLARGRRRNRLALERYRDCMESGVWPGYTGLPFTTLSAPRWALYEQDGAA